MPVLVYRCSHCRREVLVRGTGPMSPAEVQRRIDEELRAAATGPRGHMSAQFRLRDDIWVGVSGTRGDVPRAQVPERCPACSREDTLTEERCIDG